MNDFRNLLDSEGFRTNQDFGEFVADISLCEESGEKFYMCREGKLNKLLSRVEKNGLVIGMATGFFVTVIGFLLVNSHREHGL